MCCILGEELGRCTYVRCNLYYNNSVSWYTAKRWREINKWCGTIVLLEGSSVILSLLFFSNCIGSILSFVKDDANVQNEGKVNDESSILLITNRSRKFTSLTVYLPKVLFVIVKFVFRKSLFHGIFRVTVPCTYQECDLPRQILFDDSLETTSIVIMFIHTKD